MAGTFTKVRAARVAGIFARTRPIKFSTCMLQLPIRELKQPWRRRRQERHKFAYLTMKKEYFCPLSTCFYHFRFARAFFIFTRAFVIFVHSAVVLVPSTTWNNLFCSYVDDYTHLKQILSFLFPFLGRPYHVNSEIVSKHFENQTIWNNPAMIAETWGYIFR